MRRFLRISGCAAAAAVLLLLVPVPASAGGPTSVILVSPGRGVTASLYTTDDKYNQLMRLVGDHPADDPAAPASLQGGPGTDAINITWLIHDVQVWRVDRVFIEAEGEPWIETLMTTENGIAFDQTGARHRASQSKELLWLLSTLRLIGESTQPANDSANDGAKAPVAGDGVVSEPVATVAAERDVASVDWLWLLIGAAGGAVLVVGLRPLVRRLRPN